MMSFTLGSAEPRMGSTNWDNLKQLAPGDDIRIVLKDAKSYGAKFQSVSEEALVIRLATGEQTFNRQSVLRVSSKGQSHHGRNAGIGAAIGAGGGAAILAASRQRTGILLNTSRGKLAVAGAVIGALVGAAVGAALPSGGWRDVYRAR